MIRVTRQLSPPEKLMMGRAVKALLAAALAQTASGTCTLYDAQFTPRMDGTLAVDALLNLSVAPAGEEGGDHGGANVVIAWRRADGTGDATTQTVRVESGHNGTLPVVLHRWAAATAYEVVASCAETARRGASGALAPLSSTLTSGSTGIAAFDAPAAPFVSVVAAPGGGGATFEMISTGGRGGTGEPAGSQSRRQGSLLLERARAGVRGWEDGMVLADEYVGCTPPPLVRDGSAQTRRHRSEARDRSGLSPRAEPTAITTDHRASFLVGSRGMAIAPPRAAHPLHGRTHARKNTHRPALPRPAPPHPAPRGWSDYLLAFDALGGVVWYAGATPPHPADQLGGGSDDAFGVVTIAGTQLAEIAPSGARVRNHSAACDPRVAADYNHESRVDALDAAGGVLSFRHYVIDAGDAAGGLQVVLSLRAQRAPSRDGYSELVLRHAVYAAHSPSTRLARSEHSSRRRATVSRRCWYGTRSPLTDAPRAARCHRDTARRHRSRRSSCAGTA